MVVVYKDGHSEVPGLKLHVKDDDTDDLSIGGEKGKRSGSAAAPSSEGNPNGRLKAAALSQLGNTYAKIKANPGAAEDFRKQYPGMFDANGNLLPRQVLIDRVNQRYGG